MIAEIEDLLWMSLKIVDFGVDLAFKQIALQITAIPAITRSSVAAAEAFVGEVVGETIDLDGASEDVRRFEDQPRLVQDDQPLDQSVLAWLVFPEASRYVEGMRLIG